MKNKTMQNKSRVEKIHTQHSLNWSLKIGKYLGTLNLQKAIKLANVKPVVFHRWISGALAAPANKLERIKHHAFAVTRRKPRKQLNQLKINDTDEQTIRARFVWKQMIFDQLRMVAKRRFCIRLKMQYS
ncbi:MAG: hypothetical protein ACTS9Y_13475 [Methylophilus sp.]|uniref:hypothetical protein n=1 Tax=Methylophilus sp. TaxID=29541 RepID=UPI003F9EF298